MEDSDGHTCNNTKTIYLSYNFGHSFLSSLGKLCLLLSHIPIGWHKPLRD